MFFYDIILFLSINFLTFAKRLAIVSGHTPPGKGVYADTNGATRSK